MMPMIGAATMWAIAPDISGPKGQRQEAIIAGVGAVLKATLEGYHIDTPLRIAHFLAQACHETDGFCTTEEYASGAAYEGRADLGNNRPGDGRRFKGRGLFQLTGRANYGTYSSLGVDLMANPSAAAEPVLSLKIACEFWKRHGLNPFADVDDIVTITRRINGGKNGLPERIRYLAKAKAALSSHVAEPIVDGNPGDGRPVLHRGSTGDAVGDLQRLLRKLGYILAIDEDFGPTTDYVVRQFQATHSLIADGVVGPMTWKAIEAAD